MLHSNSTAREITLLKGPHGYGFKIVGGTNNDGVSVSNILYGGPAYLDGRLRVGDIIERVNEKYFLNISHDEAANFLKVI